MGRYKTLIGPRLRARGFTAQQTEAAIGLAMLNRRLVVEVLAADGNVPRYRNVGHRLGPFYRLNIVLIAIGAAKRCPKKGER